MADESLQEILFGLVFMEFVMSGSYQVIDTVGAVVGQLVSLAVTPHAFHGVEFGGVARQFFEVESSVFGHERLHGPTAMHVQPIPDHDDPAPVMSHLFPQEADDFRLLDRDVRVQTNVASHPTTGGRDRDGANGRDAAIAPRVGHQQRCLPAQTPGATDQRRQQQPGFIEKNQRGLPASCVFLMRSQATEVQRAMAASSRCRARRCGF